MQLTRLFQTREIMAILKTSLFTVISAVLITTTASCRSKTDETETVAPPVKVRVEVIGDSLDSTSGIAREYSGTTASSSVTTISFSVGGTIRALNVEEGQKVAKGQILGSVNAGDYENANNIARAQLAEAQDAYQRLKKLHDANALPDIKWVEIQQKLKQAENAAQLSERTLSDAVLRSPVAGSVSRKFANPGQNVIPGEPIYEIVSSGNLTIDVAVTEKEIGDFQIGQKALVTFSNPDIAPLEGKVSQKSVVADPLTRAFTVKVNIPSEEGKILPGMVGSVSFPGLTADNPAAVNLPAQAVQLAEDNRNFVWIVKDGKAQRRFVSVNELVADGVVVEKGLEKGDSVIVEGMRKVGTGTLVKADI